MVATLYAPGSYSLVTKYYKFRTYHNLNYLTKYIIAKMLKQYRWFRMKCC